MKKEQTKYLSDSTDFQLYVNEDAEDGERFSGILCYWGTREELIAKLQDAIKTLKELDNKSPEV
jgi:hypothetical protein